VAIVLALLSSAMWGSADFLGGVVSRRVKVTAVVGWEALIGLAICTVAAVYVGGFHGPWDWLWWGIAAGSAGSFGLGCYYAALSSGTMGVVSPIAALGVTVPVLVGFLSGEDPSVLQVAGIVVSIIGTVFTSGPELSGGASPRPVALAVLSGVLFGVFFLFMKAGAEVSSLMTLWSMRACVAVFFVLVALVRRTTGAVSAADVRLIAVVATGDLLANFCFGIASTLGYLSITSVLSSLYPVATVILARVVLQERLRAVQIGGVVVTLAGVALISAG
jgi:drug/metabolite transporter (DMT)-like permease